MKRSGLLCLLIAVAIHAAGQIRLGVKGGLNLSDVVLNNVNNPDLEPAYKMKAGFHIGVFASIDGEYDFGLSAELLYSQKGVSAFNRINLHYIAIPILLRYRLNDSWVVEGGPEIGYLVSANSKYGNLNGTWDNKLDIGLDAGLFYQLGKIDLGLRFNAGFLSVVRTEPGLNGERIRYLNRVLQFSVAIPLREI